MDVVQRLLEGRFSVWKRKKEGRLDKRAKAKEKKIKEWVSSIASDMYMHVHVINVFHASCENL